MRLSVLRCALALGLMLTSRSFAQDEAPIEVADTAFAILTAPVPRRPELPADVAAEVEEMDVQVEAMRATFLAGEIESLDEAIGIAERVHALRVEHQSGWTDADWSPAEWYEVADARRAASNLRALVVLSDGDLAALVQAETLEDEMIAAYGRGEYATAGGIVARQLVIRRRVLGEDHPDTLTSIGNMGVLLDSQRKLSEAEPYYRDALEGRRRVLGDDHPDTLASVNNMGDLLDSQRRLSEAEPYYREALEGSRRVLGDDHPDTLTTINNMGVLLKRQGKLSHAQPYFREALGGNRRVLGDNHPETLISINNMGVLLDSQGKLSEAEPYYREALERRRRLLGDDHPDTLISINNMGSLLQAQGNLSEAEPYYREALGGNRRVLGDDRPETLTSISNMGTLLTSQGKLSEAEPFYREALERRRRVLGDDHPSTLISINNMGYQLDSLGRLSEAELYYREALEGSRRVLGDDHPDTLISISNMGTLLTSQGKLSEAEPYCREALERSRRVLGDDHPDTLTSISNMGTVLDSRGKLSEAEPCYREALEGRRRLLGDDHPDTLATINNMGFLLQAQGDLSEAEPYFREALGGNRRVLGDNHPETLISINNMGVLLDSQGKLSEAEPYYREAMKVSLRLRGSATGGERGRAAMAGKVGLPGIVTSLSNLLARRSSFAEAWTIAEQGRGRALLDLLARGEGDLEAQLTDSAGLQSARVAETDARVALNIAEARLVAIENERAVIDADESLDDDARTTRLAEFDVQLDTQHDLILRCRRDLGEATANVFLALQSVMPDAKPLTIDEIQWQLEPGDILLGYSWAEDHVLLLMATRSEVDGAFVTETDQETAPLYDELVALRETLARRPLRSSPPDMTNLFARLVPDGLRSRLTSATRVIILPDGPLAGIPFEAIADPSILDIDRQQIAYASSATVYLNRRDVAQSKTGASRSTLVALGDPIFDRDSDADPEPNHPTVGVLAIRVVENSNAASAGLLRGDVILTYGGEDVRDYDHVLEIKAHRIAKVEAGERAADDPMPVRVWRDGEIIETTMTPGAMGIQLAQGNPAEGLRSMAERSRGMDERVAESSLLDAVRLHGGRLSSLPGTRAEVDRIVSTMGDDVIPLIGEEATLANLEASVDGARYVHLATHGLVGSQDRPYDASLALTQPETPSVDDIGFLTLDHLIRTWRGKLEACDLVTLSACDTQRGIRHGDALMSLPWGFYFAGAPTVIASLWQVDDIATSLLMGRMYENLLGAHDEPRDIGETTYAVGEPMTKIDSLREAKQWLRELSWEERDELLSAEIYADITRGVERSRPESPDARSEHPYEHPYYWAAFVLIGDPG